MKTYLEIRYVYSCDDEGYASVNFVENNWPLTWNDDTPVEFTGDEKE